jgi:hypothetical protein
VAPRRLPEIVLDGKRYYFDRRLDQLRNVDCPHDFVDLSADEIDAFAFRLEIMELARSESEI